MWQKIKNIYHGLVSILASIYYGFPSRELIVIGVTGTDGKTTTTHLIHHILKTAGKKVGMISSVYAEIGRQRYDTGFHVTTPDPHDIPKFLHQAVEAGERYIVLETTSHALDQNRVLGIEYTVGVITNITHEHLDYHKTYENYVRTKEKLLKKSKVAILNIDDTSFRYIDTSKYKKIVTYGLNKKAEVNPKKFPFSTPLPGEYNRYNCLAAIAVCKELGLTEGIIRKALKSFSGVKGRYEKISNKFGLNIIIDFAHTPNAFAEVLPVVKQETKGKLIHVFGAAGLRDSSKRPQMGENSAKYADYIVVTEEDYRTENVEDIIDQIAQGAFKHGAVKSDSGRSASWRIARMTNKAVLYRIPDRKEAIEFVITKLAQTGDTVILTGKAHEKSLCRGTTEYPWDEFAAVKEALSHRSS